MNLIAPNMNISASVGINGAGDNLTPLISSTVANTTADWSSSTNYVIGNEVVVNFLKYRALTANSNKPPATNAADWVNIGYANRWAMFSGTTTERSSSSAFNFVISAAGVNSLGFFAVNANTITVVMTDPTDGVVYNRTLNTGFFYEGVNDMYDYFFAPFPSSDQVRDVVALDLPNYASASISITLNGSNPKSMGMFVAGRIQNLGQALYGSSTGILDYSVKERNNFGNFNIVPRSFSNTADFDVNMMTARVSESQKLLAQYRTSPVAWFGESTLESTIIFGYWKDFDIILGNPTTSQATITVEGV